MVSSPNDPAEREAEEVAAKVMRMPEGAVPMKIRTAPPNIHRKCSACEEEEKSVRRSPAGESPNHAPRIVSEVLSQPGQPLPDSTRTFFEPKLGADLSSVRIHTDAIAAKSAEAVHARAYAVGDHIAFGSGETPDGVLLAHELAHVVGGVASDASLHRKPSAEEHQANDANDPRVCGLGTANPNCTPCYPEEKDGKRICGPPSSDTTFFEPCTALPRAIALMARNDLLTFPAFMAASTGCAVVGDVWFSYLWGSSEAYGFTSNGCVGESAKSNPKGAPMAADAAQNAFTVLMERLSDLLPTDDGQFHDLVVRTLSLSDALGIKGDDPLIHPTIEYDGAPWNAAGVLIGGVGKGGLGSDVFGDDDRVLGGKVTISVLPVDPVSGTRQVFVRYEPTVYVKDTVDFCPGNLGAGFLAQRVAITLSRLEASGVARDVPIELLYELDTLLESRSVPAKLPSDPKPAPDPTPTPVPKNQLADYIVVPGDSLRKISRRFYGNENDWRKIYEANQQVIGENPDRILPGQRLVIPL
jgi:hypothetical protein